MKLWQVVFVWSTVVGFCYVAVWAYFYQPSWWTTSVCALTAAIWAVMFLQQSKILQGYEEIFAKRNRRDNGR